MSNVNINKRVSVWRGGVARVHAPYPPVVGKQRRARSSESGECAFGVTSLHFWVPCKPNNTHSAPCKPVSEQQKVVTINFKQHTTRSANAISPPASLQCGLQTKVCHQQSRKTSGSPQRTHRLEILIILVLNLILIIYVMLLILDYV